MGELRAKLAERELRIVRRAQQRMAGLVTTRRIGCLGWMVAGFFSERALRAKRGLTRFAKRTRPGSRASSQRLAADASGKWSGAPKPNHTSDIPTGKAMR